MSKKIDEIEKELDATGESGEPDRLGPLLDFMGDAIAEYAGESTENTRRVLTMLNNAEVASSTRTDLEARHGQVWDTSELQRDFEVEGFAAPFVVVKRRKDGKRGSLEFGHSPRYYWGFDEA